MECHCERSVAISSLCHCELAWQSHKNNERYLFSSRENMFQRVWINSDVEIASQVEKGSDFSRVEDSF